jgi:hypothetical protein
MRNSTLLASAVAAGVASSALATITGNTLFGDSYLVVDGAKTYSVMDVYIKSNNAADIISSVYGVNAYKSSIVQNQGKAFKHAGNSAWRPNYTGGADAGTVDMPDGVTYNMYDHPWDSFVTTGIRYQTNDGGGSTATQVTATTFTNFGTANAATINGNTTGTNGGAGWYPLAGATVASNPFCQVSYYNGASNLAKATSTIDGNGIAAGSSLDNMYMIGRFTIDTADMTGGGAFTMTLKLAMTGISNGATVAGSTNTNFRTNTTLTFAAIPAPGAAALLGLAGLVARRRK